MILSCEPTRIRVIEPDTPITQFVFNELRVGDAVTRSVTFSPDMVAAFATLSGDHSRIHHDSAFARSAGYERPVVHGQLVFMPFSMMIGSHLPGEGCVIRNQSISFRRPVYCGRALTYMVLVERLRPAYQLVHLTLSVSDGANAVATGDCECQAAGGRGAAR